MATVYHLSTGRHRSFPPRITFLLGGVVGTAREVRELIAKLKQMVLDDFGVQLEEEVQYVS